ncbi:MAG: FHA domain-containing protein [Bdellovibrionota bacterium]
MWKLKILTGDLAGQSFSLQEGDNGVGRSPSNQIHLKSTGVSKTHCVFKVNGSAIAIKDLGSSNGTFVNGIKVDQSILQVGDRVGIHNILCEITYVISQYTTGSNYQNMGNMDGAAAPDMNSMPDYDQAIPDYAEDVAGDGTGEEHQAPPSNAKESFLQYIENVMLPGVYRLAEIFEFKAVLFSFVLAFIFVTTLLSVIPMLSITKQTIERESGRRALGIARSIVRVNQEILGKGFRSQLTTRFAEREEGVNVALIIDADDGSVIAPANEIGAYRNDQFIHAARKMDEEFVSQINDKTVGASVPIRTYDRKTGSYNISAYAVVLYNMGSLSISEGRTISLFIQTLAMALVLGAILFFFMYKLIERPFNHLSSSIDKAIKGDTRSIEPVFQFPVLDRLYTNVNSLLNQSLSDSGGGDSFAYQDPMEKQNEAKNMTNIIASPCLALNADGHFIAMNQMAESLMMETEMNLQNQSFEAIGDMSLQLSLKDLWERCVADTRSTHSNNIEMGGVDTVIEAQAITTSSNIDYIIVTFNHLAEQGDY